MSRTQKGKKPAGFEPWTARPFNRHGGTPGPFHKKRTHKAERQQGKQQAQLEDRP